MALRAKPDVTVEDILQVVEYDPSLAAKWCIGRVLRCMVIRASRFAGDRHPVGTGIESTLNLLLGSCMGQTFHIPVDGPVGLQAFWRRSIYCASLASELAKLLPEPTHVKPGLAYLCGLLHDFGYLVLGHVFPAAFSCSTAFWRSTAVCRSRP